MAMKPIEPDIVMTQDFVAGASILIHKWQDRFKQYDSFHQQAMHIVPELDLSFEGEKIKEVTS
jgi:hypothetical protein